MLWRGDVATTAVMGGSGEDVSSNAAAMERMVMGGRHRPRRHSKDGMAPGRVARCAWRVEKQGRR